MLSSLNIAESLKDLILTEAECLVQWQRQLAARDELHRLLELLFRPGHDAANDHAFRYHWNQEIERLVPGCRQEPNQGDDTTVCDAREALLHRPQSAYLDDVVRAMPPGDAVDLGGPVRGSLVVDRVVRAKLGFHVFQLLVTR